MKPAPLPIKAIVEVFGEVLTSCRADDKETRSQFVGVCFKQKGYVTGILWRRIASFEVTSVDNVEGNRVRCTTTQGEQITVNKKYAKVRRL